MSDLLDIINKNPQDIFSNDVKSADILKIVKTIFDPIASKNSVLEEIHYDGLDASQVWGQAKLVLDGVNENILFGKIPELKSKHDALNDRSDEDDESEHSQISADESELDQEDFDPSGFEIQGDEASEEGDSGFDSDEDAKSGEDFDSEEELNEQEESLDVEPNTEKDESATAEKDFFGLNDEFFDIEEFNRQTLAAENGEDPFANKDDDEDVDLFQDLEDDDEEEEMPEYKDFFDMPAKPENTKVNSKKARKQCDEDEDDIFGEEEFNKAIGSTMLDLFDGEEKSNKTPKENLSTFEKHQKKMAEEISKLEQESIAEKKWSMKGESKAKDRPADSLLEEELEFERTAKPVPVITAEVTESLEEMIRRRIKNEEFDDLARRVISDVTKFKPSRFELNESKSSKSLAEIYEDEFHKIDPDAEVNESIKKAHEEISQMFQTLTHKLDALCSAHFIPKPAQKSIDIKVQTDTISMEDAQPLALSTESTLAPQEVYKIKSGISDNEIKLKSGIIMSKDELTRDDKQRIRRANKRKRSKEFNNPDKIVKKSKKSEIIDTLSKSNVTVIGSKGEKRDVKGNLKKDKKAAGSSNLKL